jgi:hypothetical protein
LSHTRRGRRDTQRETERDRETERELDARAGALNRPSTSSYCPYSPTFLVKVFSELPL